MSRTVRLRLEFEMALGGVWLMVTLMALAGLVLLIMALVDLVKRPAAQWEASGHNQLVWALIVVFVGFIGPLLYLVVARPALDAVAQRELVEGYS